MIFIALIGVTLLIVRGTIFASVRKVWPQLLGCSQCTGTWVGIGAGATQIASITAHPILDAVLVGGATSFLALTCDAILLHLLDEE